ncbi:hypothetical protein HYR69_03435 [Candidatus Sumerlaeota bacterium]|nr:hypothetical protein [Candidatus Sumerlaeota bacterium]MBI3735433.1 hypothetical protein [Candidatus Sumerlaeota bacterium]
MDSNQASEAPVQTSGADGNSSQNTPLFDLLAAFLFFAIAFYLGYQWRNLESDDNMIALRYARNLINGYGWVYNIGQDVNGVTSALHTLLLAAVGYFAWPDLKLAGGIVFGFGLGGAAFFTYLLFRSRSLAVGFWAGIMTVFLNLLPGSVGLEMSLYLMLGAGSLYFYQSERYRCAAATLALLFLTRPDGGLLALILICHYLGTHRSRAALCPRRIAQCAAIYILILAPWLIVSDIQFGDILPNTVSAKIVQGQSGWWGKGPIFFEGIFDWAEKSMTLNEYAFFNWKPYAFLAAAGALASLIRLWRHLPALAWIAAYTLIYGYFNFPPYHWYYVPIHWGVMLFCAAALESAWISAQLLRPRWTHAARGILALGALALIEPCFPDFFKELRPVNPHYRAAADWFRENTPSDASIACDEIGVFGYYIENRRIVDIIGLVTPGGHAKIAKGDFTWWYDLYKPDYIMFHDPIWSFEQQVDRSEAFAREYQLVKTIDQFEGHKLKIYLRRAG